MRFVVQHKKASYINFLVILFSFAVYGFLILYLMFKYISNELFPSDVIVSLKGNPEEFLEPKSLEAVVEFMHIESFLFIVLLLMVLSIFIRTNFNDKLKIYVAFLLFLSAFLYFSSTFGVMYISNYLAYVNFLSLVVFSLGVIVVNTLNIFCFITGRIK